jgi:hypothetical protein
VRLAHDQAHAAVAHGLDDRGEMSGARRHAGFGLDEADEIKPEPPRQVGPGVVVGDHRLAPHGGELSVPVPQLSLETFEKSQTIRFVIGAVCRVDLCQCLEDIAGYDLGILGIKPVVGISACVGMPVGRTDARASLIEDRDR